MKKPAADALASSLAQASRANPCDSWGGIDSFKLASMGVLRYITGLEVTVE
jgi:hypothetical protein